jgi:hypothetical protein
MQRGFNAFCLHKIWYLRQQQKIEVHLFSTFEVQGNYQSIDIS